VLVVVAGLVLVVVAGLVLVVVAGLVLVVDPGLVLVVVPGRVLVGAMSCCTDNFITDDDVAKYTLPPLKAIPVGLVYVAV
jgi:hypothetical protein